jgi:hypothetical protein
MLMNIRRSLLMALMATHMALPAAAVAEDPHGGRSGGPASEVGTVDYPGVSPQPPPTPGDVQPSRGGYAQPYPSGTTSGGGFPPLDYAPPSAGPASQSDAGQGGSSRYGSPPSAGAATQAPTTGWTEREAQRPRSAAPGYPQHSPGQYPPGGTPQGQPPAYPGIPAPPAGGSYPSGPSAGAQGGDYGGMPDVSQYPPLEEPPAFEQPPPSSAHSQPRASDFATAAPRGGYEQPPPRGGYGQSQPGRGYEQPQYRGGYTPSQPYESGSAQRRQQPAGAPPAGGWQAPAWPYPATGAYVPPPPYPGGPYPGWGDRRRHFDMPFFPFSW